MKRLGEVFAVQILLVKGKHLLHRLLNSEGLHSERAVNSDDANSSPRLKTKLDLPDIQVRPPCSKKVYNKLFAYLDSTLAITKNGTSRTTSAAATPSRTPLKRKHQQDVRDPPTPSKPPQTHHTSKSESTAASAQKKSKVGTSTNRYVNGQPLNDKDPIPLSCPDELLPPWIMHSIRLACKTVDTPKLAPHVFAAFSATSRELFRLEEYIADDNDVFPLDKIPALILIVLSRILSERPTDAQKTNRNNQGKASQTSYEKALKKLFSASSATPSTAHLILQNFPPLKNESSEAIQEFEVDYREDCKDMLFHLTKHDWFSLEVFENARTAKLSSQNNSEDDESDSSSSQIGRKRRLRNGNGNGYSGEGGDQGTVASLFSRQKHEVSIGGGEMLNFATDWLSEEREREYKVWQAKTMRLIEEKLHA
jgi:hypothetical protein